jgi:hypothetical protein
MQNELQRLTLDQNVQLGAINKYEDFDVVGYNAGMSERGAIPLLQDVDQNRDGESDVWTDWGVSWRDIVIVNSDNEAVGVVNVDPVTYGGYDLGVPENYSALRQIIVDVANGQPFWQNPTNALDVNNDGSVSASDVLACLNELNSHEITGGPTQLPLPMPPNLPAPYVDVNGDGKITPIDVLIVINHLNSPPAAEPEPPALPVAFIDVSQDSVWRDTLAARHQSPPAEEASKTKLVVPAVSDNDLPGMNPLHLRSDSARIWSYAEPISATLPDLLIDELAKDVASQAVTV